MVDIDGQFVYSKTIVLTVDCDKSTVLIYPNPASDLINVSIAEPSPAAAKKTAVLTDATGRVMLTQLLSTGNNKIQVNNLMRGMYTLTIEGNKGIEIHKIVISR